MWRGKRLLKKNLQESLSAMSSSELAEAIQSIFELVDRPVWIVTSGDSDRRGGLVATWVNQDLFGPQPPTLVVAVAKGHFTAELIEASRAFAAHLIRPDQLELVWRFAIGSGRDRDKLADVDFKTAETGSPVLADCLAWLDCRVVETKDAGDRMYYWAEVVSAGRNLAGPSLAQREVFRRASLEQLESLKAAKLADIEAQRPLWQAYRDGLR
jgi:flavin reductase (DIM6/NTAB) family NADH-FMN oxidoreductase RutF